MSSSNLSSVGYEPDSKTLEIAFKNGSVYQYFNVPESIYKGLISAISKGRYHARNIKRSFAYKKVN